METSYLQLQLQPQKFFICPTSRQEYSRMCPSNSKIKDASIVGQIAASISHFFQE